MLFAVLRAFRTRWSDDFTPLLAAGAIAGEALIGIFIAALLASGLLSG